MTADSNAAGFRHFHDQLTSLKETLLNMSSKAEERTDIAVEALMNRDKEKAKLVAQAAKDALQLIAEHVSKFSIQCGYSEANGYLFSQNRKENNELLSVHEACRDVGIESEFVETLPVDFKFDNVLMFKHQAKFSPLDYIQGLALAFEKAGGVIRQNCRVNDVNGNEPLSVETTDGMSVRIVGFPLGFHDTLHHLPVVRQAVIASSFGLRFQGQGYFLTDARTHRGTSGAPVVMRLPSPPEDDDQELPWRLLGVHSARLDMKTRDEQQDESLGLNCAWYADILLTLTT